MKHFLKHIILFSIIFFVVEKGCYYFIQHAPTKEYDKRLELILKGEMNKDVVIIGSSRGANNIIAKQLEQETKLSTYNLSYRGSNIDFHEFILSTLLKYNKPPKKVFLVIDPVYEFKKEKTLNFRIDRLFPLKKYNYINNELIKRNKKNILSKFFCVSRVSKKDFNLKKVNVLPINIMSSHGSKIITSKKERIMTFNNNIEIYSKQDEKQEQIDSFYKIQALCKLQEIELIFVFPPNHSRFNMSFYKRFRKLIKKENRILVYDTLNPKYKNKDYYRDESHLLKKGAEIFTSEISEFILNSK
ncbi:hypothetical protein A8C32_00825 [Flavivirga aquatica]|uniref:DUF1574 domain-containing protein n=1 Tax=Flavivirga aquatica TaxID=1849968 RepID=A0A1E5TBV4_9FLAO|nr:hypothetical protein [Flavivirga aquatica]OEK08852.1 hypothetical protein A8C32_00825 [Flavivirga aquatica]